ncbi:MAG: hypothetical protein C4297_06520 [Gemmataceae bacterium]
MEHLGPTHLESQSADYCYCLPYHQQETYSSQPVRLCPTGARYLTVRFERDPAQDGEKDKIRYEGYRIFWPNGEPVGVSLKRFCQQGCRLIGLGKRMQGRLHLLVELGIHPVSGLEAPLTRLGPGVRTRRLFLERRRSQGRIHFFNGTATDIIFDLRHDDPRVLYWLGLPSLSDGNRMWFDLSARTLPD